MHCECCDKLLTDIETRIRLCESGEFASTCLDCLESSGVGFKLPTDQWDIEEEDILYEVDMDAPLYDDEDLWNER